MVSLMGAPPKQFLERSEKCRQYWNSECVKSPDEVTQLFELDWRAQVFGSLPRPSLIRPWNRVRCVLKGKTENCYSLSCGRSWDGFQKKGHRLKSSSKMVSYSSLWARMSSPLRKWGLIASKRFTSVTCGLCPVRYRENLSLLKKKDSFHVGMSRELLHACPHVEPQRAYCTGARRFNVFSILIYFDSLVLFAHCMLRTNV